MRAKPSRQPATGRNEHDAALVMRVLNGDDAAFAMLVTRHQAMLYRYARGMGFDHDTAADAVQESLVRAYQQLSTCRQPDRFGSWLLRILRNFCLDHGRSGHARNVPLTEAMAGTLATRAPQPELRTVVQRALDQLPDGLREAFLLKHVEEWSYEEMADAMDASVSALKMRVHRARDLLRQALAPDFDVSM